ncbi:2711_t:CDS:2, partial [Acaulospora colombiana]
ELNGTYFRYPLRTPRDAEDSLISKKVYRPEEILDMFERFYEKESIDCLLFLKYIEVIKFYELKEGEKELNLLYEISLENADEIRTKRQLIVQKIVPMMDLLDTKDSNKIAESELESTFTANFCQQKGQRRTKTNLMVVDNYFKEHFKRDIKEHKFVPNVGLAMRLDDKMTNGTLFCFLPFPISTPFQASIHGYFA